MVSSIYTNCNISYPEDEMVAVAVVGVLWSLLWGRVGDVGRVPWEGVLDGWGWIYVDSGSDGCSVLQVTRVYPSLCGCLIRIVVLCVFG